MSQPLMASFDLVTHMPSTRTIKVKKDTDRLRLEKLYGQVREFREGSSPTISRNKVLGELKAHFPNDWLLSIELLELAQGGSDREFASEILEHLEEVKLRRPEVGHLIDDGITLARGETVSYRNEAS